MGEQRKISWRKFWQKSLTAGRKHRLLLLGLLVLVGAGSYCIFQLMQPRYLGKAEAYWVDSLGNGSWPPPHWQDLGSNRIPILLKGLERRDDGLATFYRHFVEKLPNGLGRYFPKPAVNADICRNNACLRLIDMGEKARPVIPNLVVMLKTDRNSAVRSLIATCLANIGSDDPAVIAALTDASLQDQNPQTRSIAGGALKMVDSVAAAKAGLR